jgi:hypothetical protein
VIAVHTIAAAPSPAPLVVFLHGLDGDALTTWGLPTESATFPRRVAAAFPGCAVVSLGYPARLGRFLREPNFTVAPIAAALAETLAILGDGRPRVAIIGYCLGGLLASLALRQIRPEGCGPPAFLALMDAPLLLPAAGDPYPEVTSALGFEPEPLAVNVAWLRDEVLGSRLRLATIVSEAPGWVAPYAREALSPPAPLARVAGDHLALARAPTTGDFAPLDILRPWLRVLFAA